MSLQIEDLIENEIYVAQFRENTKGILFKWEGKFQKGCKYLALNLNGERLIRDSYLTANVIINLTFKKATNIQKNWLNQCIKIDDFIPLSEVKEDSINILNNLELW